MSTLTGLLNIKQAVSTLNPEQVRHLSRQPVTVGIRASSTEAYAHIQEYLLAGLSPERRADSSFLIRPNEGDIVIHDPAVHMHGGVVLRPGHEAQMLAHVLHEHEDLAIPLARAFPPFRKQFVKQIIGKTARENAFFSLTTALPDVIPNLIELPWAVAEFASDTAFITMNQLRMAFLIAAASDREVGYREQRSEIASVIAGAFGWRALARQVIGKIPFGGGLIGKTAIAYAGTKVAGISLGHLYSVGYHYTRHERATIYSDALEQGRRVAADILRRVRPDVAEKMAERAASKLPMVYPRGDRL